MRVCVVYSNKTLIIITITTTTKIIIITLKGTIRCFFYNLLTAPQTVSNTYTQAARAQSCATHCALIKCNMLCATWYEGTAQLLNLTVLITPILPFFSSECNHEPGKRQYPDKTADDDSQKIPHTTFDKIKAPSETGTLTLALVTGQESRRAHHYTKHPTQTLVCVCECMHTCVCVCVYACVCVCVCVCVCTCV